MPSPIPADDQQLEDWLSQGLNRERIPDYADWKLAPVHRALAALELPRPLRPITVAGTKGKGSTVAFLEALFAAHGRPAIAFSSPHVLQLRERWRHGGALVPVAELAAYCPQVDRALEISGHLAATYFERSFLLACCLASDHPAAPFICEVGLGGRLDCANTLDASMVCLTSLGLDHTHILGDTLNAIAGEKLGVCRPDAPLLVAAQSADAQQAISERCPTDITPQSIPPLDPCPPLGLAGAHQAANAALAIAAGQQVLGADYDPALATQALAQAHLPGRCQFLQCGDLDLIVDGAHTRESLRATLACADAHFAGDYSLILGTASDKDVAALCACIPDHRPVIRCGYAGPRCLREHDPRWPADVRHWPWAEHIIQALAIARRQGARRLLISGSFYLAGEALTCLQALETSQPSK